MPIYRDNDLLIKSTAITDENGDAVTTGTVEAAILSEDGTSTLVAAAAMTHVAGGVWQLVVQSSAIDTGIASTVTRARVRVTVGSGTPPDASWDEIVDVKRRIG